VDWPPYGQRRTCLSWRRPGEIYIKFQICKRPARRLIAPPRPIDGRAGVGVPYLSAAEKSACGYGAGEGGERYSGLSKLGERVICRLADSLVGINKNEEKRS
jgi:hypothetical protein